MSNRTILAVLFLCLYASSSFAKKKDTENFSPGPQPPMFIENAGQFIDQQHQPVPQVNFMLKTNGMKVFVESGAIHYQFAKADTGQHPKIHTYTLDVTLLGANKNAVIQKEDQADYHESYFLPQCPKGVTAYCYRKVTYKDVYPGIDMALHANGNKLEYDFIVHEGADPRNIRIKYDGAISLKIKNGDLVAHTPMGYVTEQAPYSYEAQSGKEIKSSFQLSGNTVTIKTAGHKGDMVIDPVLMFATYYGGFYDEHANAVAWNNTTVVPDLMIMVGTTDSYDPLVMAYGSPVQGTHSGIYGDGTYDGFIAAYTSSGLKQWATFFGGTGNDAFMGVTCDKNGNVYVGGGVNSANLATTGRTTLSGTPANSTQYADGIVLKLSPNGQSLMWSTYYGGNGIDQVNALAVDANNNLYITGVTRSTSGIATPGAYQSTNPNFVNKAFIAKLDVTGSVSWSTFYSNIFYSDNDDAIGNSMFCDKNGYVYFAGNITHTNYAVPFMAPIQVYHRSYITKFSANGSLIKEKVFMDTGTATTTIPSISYNGSAINSIAYDTTSFMDSSGKPSSGLIYASGSHFEGFNTDLDVLWRKTDPNNMTSIAVSPNHTMVGTGYLIRPGFTQADAFLAEYTQQAFQNISYFGSSSGSENAFGIATNDQDRSFICGFTDSRTGFAYYNTIYTNQISKDYIGETSSSSTLSGDAFFAGFDNDGPIVFNIGVPGSPPPNPVCKGAGYSYPFLAINPAGGAVFTNGTSYTLQLSDSSGDFQHNINIGHGKIYGSIIVRIPDTIPAGTNYKLRIIANNPFLMSGEIGVTILDAPNPVLSTNSPVCQDDTLKASFTDTTKGNVTYAWYKQGASSFYPGLSLSFANATPADNGNYILQSKLGICIVTDTIQMIVKPKPAVASITNNTPICAEQPLQITIHDTNTAAVVYSWTGPNGYAASAKDTTILNANTSMTGVYHLTYGLNGCYRYDSTDVVVNIKPGFDSVTTNAPICDNDTLQLFANSTLANAAYYWHGPAGFSSTDQNPVFKADLTATGYYNVFAKLGNCVSDTDSVQVIVKPLPAKPRLSSNSPVKPGKDILLAMDSVTDATYSWTGPDDFTSTDQNAVVSYVTTDAGGVYTGTVTVNGCSTSNMIKVEIDARDANAYFTLLFPNPNKGTFTVKGILQKAGNIPLQVRDAAGQMVYSTTLQSDKKRLEQEVMLPGSLANGTYFVRLLINGEQKTIPFTLGK